MGAYEVQVAPYLTIGKLVTPEGSVALQGTITYAAVLDNAGVLADGDVLLTDTLPANTSFGRWIEQPPGVVVEDGVITWQGAVEAGEAIELVFDVDYACGGYGETFTNTAVFSGTLQAARAQVPFTVEPGVLYVDAEAIGGGTGLSWVDAYPNLQDALDRTNVHSRNSYEIWVAEGVYYPDEDADGDHMHDDEGESFTLSYDNVQLYGGFAGNETARDQRDWEANVTVLSGDVDGDDTTDDHGVVITTTHINGGNANHVLHLDGETNEPITGRTVIDGFTITAGHADDNYPDNIGGGIYCEGGVASAECSPALTNVTLNSNLASALGGAMYSGGCDGGTSNPILTNVTFNNNSTTGDGIFGNDGGAMYNDGGGNGISSPMLTNVTFTGNSAGDGGAMYNGGGGGISSPILTNVTFTGNSAGDGGAMYNHGGSDGVRSPTLTNVTFIGNSASRGGAMFNYSQYGTDSSPTLTNVTFSGNSASYDGGALYNHVYYSTSSPVLRDVTFSGNSANGDGGAMYIVVEAFSECSLTLTNVTFSSNSAEGIGGAMYNRSYIASGYDEFSLTLKNVAFTDNSAVKGGAMYNHSGWVSDFNLTLTNVTFSGNSASDDGGAVCNFGTDSTECSPVLNNIVFTANSADGVGGAMCNRVGGGGTSSPTLTNVTFSGNSAEERGGAVYNDGHYGDSSPTLTNVILWGNTAGGDGHQVYNREATPAISYSLVESGWDGDGIYNDEESTVTDLGGNTDADPQFVDAAGGNLHLQGTSPAIDAGDNSAVPAGITTDLDGGLRFVDISTVPDTGKGTPPIVDMGAYEVQNRVYLPVVVRNHE
jgi:uncharacterized repeat protein (TIGR01451 family)